MMAKRRYIMRQRGGHLDIVKLLLERGVDPNVQDHDGETPLHYAARRGHLDMV